MALFAARHPDTQRLRRNWIGESLLVLAILGFGFLAVTLDALPSPWQSEAASAPAGPVELLR